MKKWALAWIFAASLGACGEYKETDLASTSLDAQEENTVLIANIAPLSGSTAHLGKDSESGARLAIQQINDNPPEIGGRVVRFRLVSEDDQGDPKVATDVAKKIVRRNIAAVIGHLNSGSSIPASKIYADAGMVQISPSSTHPAYTQQGFTGSFRLIANDAHQGQALARFASDTLRIKTLAIIDDRTVYAQGVVDELLKNLDPKIRIVKREFTSPSAKDFTAILTAIAAAKPDLIFFGGMDVQAALLVKQMKRMNLSQKLLAPDAVMSAEFVKIAGEAAEGHYASFPGVPKMKMPNFGAFQHEFLSKYGEVQLYSPYAYDAVFVLVEAMKKADSTDPKVFIHALRATEWTGVTGEIRFDEFGDLQNPSVTIYQVKQAQWQMLQTWQN